MKKSVQSRCRRRTQKEEVAAASDEEGESEVAVVATSSPTDPYGLDYVNDVLDDLHLTYPLDEQQAFRAMRQLFCRAVTSHLDADLIEEVCCLQSLVLVATALASITGKRLLSGLPSGKAPSESLFS